MRWPELSTSACFLLNSRVAGHVTAKRIDGVVGPTPRRTCERNFTSRTEPGQMAACAARVLCDVGTLLQDRRIRRRGTHGRLISNLAQVVPHGRARRNATSDRSDPGAHSQERPSATCARQCTNLKRGCESARSSSAGNSGREGRSNKEGSSHRHGPAADVPRLMTRSSSDQVQWTSAPQVSSRSYAAV